MTELADTAARRRALSDLDSTLLVEAGAGTGKTSLLAGRLALLLARGISPRSIAAITFTELAASELAARVRTLIHALLRGEVPAAVAAALPEGLSTDQREALQAGSDRLDGLTTATIHSFCQELIRGYAVEADIDPGAQVMDRDAADLAFDQVFDRWLARRLSGEPGADDPIAVLAREDPRRMAEELRRLALFRRRHRSARPRPPDLSGRPDLDLADAVDSYRRWASQAPAEPVTLALLDDLETLSRFFAGRFATPPDFSALWAMTTPPHVSSLLRNSLALRAPRTLTAWRKAAGDVDGARLEAESLAAFAQVETAYTALLGRVGGALVHALSGELDELMADYAAYKRAAAVLDFDDLLQVAGALLQRHEPVRAALARRFEYLLVDEFQDTDPVQCDIIFRLATDAPRADWAQIAPRAGALFLVGDPKQAVYRFRGASVETYEIAKAAIRRAWPDNVLQVTANFRSRTGILTYVNDTFAAPLMARAQPGYVPLVPTRGEVPQRVSVARLPIALPAGVLREEAQDAEADAVADACARLVGATWLHDGQGRDRPVTPADIALLAPTGTDLWRYERALERVGLPFASQAGKGLFRRQETQDLLALARVLADGRDTVAFGALLRGPLVGLTDEALLDLAEMSADGGEGPATFSIVTPLDQVADPDLRQVLAILQSLRRRARRTSPARLLGEAVERLGVRPILALRDRRQAAAAIANVDALLARARRYAVRGLRQFVQDLSEDWREAKPAAEGRVEADGQAIEIVTMHSAKGLEWPIVIPINAMIQTRPAEPHIHRADDDSLHWRVGGVAAPDLTEAIVADTEAAARERVRLWYVACTRAQDLLLVPQLQNASPQAWARALDLNLDPLPVLVLGRTPVTAALAAEDPPNAQDAATFAAEAARIAAASPPVHWVRPSVHDVDRAVATTVIAEALDDADGAPEPIAGGRVRGLLLHKLIEEVLEEDLVETSVALEGRAAALRQEVEVLAQETDIRIDPGELAATVVRTLSLPDVAALRPRLRAEVTVWGLLGSDLGEEPLAGRADAVAVTATGVVDVVLDWKSDVSPTPAQVALHGEQLRSYLAVTGARRGALVYMSLGRVVWLDSTD
jgi:CRISPR-associated exonuclease Cas4